MRYAAVIFVLLLLFVPLSAHSLPADGTMMVVPVPWLKEHLSDKDLVLLHVGTREEYDAGHIPGARFVQLSELSLTKEETDLSLQLAPAERLRAAFEKLGVSNDSRIVLYFGKDWVSPTTRVYFTLDYIGLGDRASILDGGMPAWAAAGNDLSKDVPAVKPGALRVTANDDLVAKADWINANLANSGVKIVDARNPQFYTGANAGGQPRAGRIKGAKNIPFDTVVDSKNTFYSEDVLRKKFTDAGVTPSATVVTYCHIGQQASVDYFVARMLGYKVKLYDGSYQEWSRLAQMPIETSENVTPVAQATPPAQVQKAVAYNSPSWSPDSKRLAFTRMDITRSTPMKIDADLYIVAADGSGLKRVTGDGQNEFNPVWTRDGKTLFFGSVFEAGKSGDVYSIGVDGGGLKRVTTDLPHASAPELSRDGKWIVFNVSIAEHKPQIYVMKADGSSVKALTSDNTLAFYNPVWSPDGKRIVYYVEKGDQKDQIWSMNADGTDQKLLSGNIGHNFYPSWTSDGKRIIFTSNRDGKQGLYSMNADGSDVKFLGIEGSFARQSPDGKKLVYTAGSWPNVAVYVSNADGTASVKVTP